jgi:UDP-N-acetylglucosamine--N-acetylmuramyl-(pentapeptide) pyrophosphoryl-undecaprenol N-acetylglucosamine transferase
VGGYASGPTLWMAQMLGIPTLIQEQNSYAGLTNKLLAKRADCICVAYPGMERFFPAKKIKLLGNPIRQNYGALSIDKNEAYAYFELNSNKKTILVTGGSLGARTLNECVLRHWETIAQNSDIQILWQVGEYYYKSILQTISNQKLEHVHCCDFIYRMDLAYAIADVIISRAGAGTISELCLVGTACILIPSPNVTEDHQTKNARSLADRNAAKMIDDHQAAEKAIPMALELLQNNAERSSLSKQILTLGLPNAAQDIALEIISLTKK